MCKHICSQMNVAIAAMIAGCLRHRRRDHAVTRIHDTTAGAEGSGVAGACPAEAGQLSSDVRLEGSLGLDSVGYAAAARVRRRLFGDATGSVPSGCLPGL